MRLKFIWLIYFSLIVQGNAYADDLWVCDKTDTKWNCAGNNKIADYEKSISAVASSATTTTIDNASTPSQRSQSKPNKIKKSNRKTAVPEALTRPSKFPADSFSIQLFASSSKDTIINLIKKYQLPSLILKYETQEKTLFLWIAGTYVSRTDAEIELSRLPTLEAGISPWIRTASTLADMPVLIRAKL